jgi:hypothetical protein
MRPEENRQIETQRQPKTRRTVRLTTPDDSQPDPATVSQTRRVPAMPRLSLKDRLLRVAELAVGDWAPTLREALLRVLVFAVVLVAVGIAFGPAIAVLGAVVGFLMFLVSRSRAGAAG